MLILRVCLKLLFVWIVLAGSYEIVSATEPWRVNLAVEPIFPEGVVSNLKLDLVYPASAVLERGERVKDDGSGDYVIRPAKASDRRPSHVKIRFHAFGFAEQELNSGILRFEKEEGTSLAFIKFTITLRGKDLPRIGNVVKLETTSQDAEAFEISIFNPIDSEILVAKLNMRLGYWGPTKCSVIDFGDPVIDIYINVDGTAVTGRAAKEAKTSEFKYPITGSVNEECDDVWINASVPVNLRVSAKTYLTVRLRIHEAQKIRWEVISRAKLFSDLERRVQEKSGQKKVDQQSRTRQKIAAQELEWTFGVRFSESLTIGAPDER